MRLLLSVVEEAGENCFMVSAIIVAAGLSKRMGKENKLLLPIQGKAMFLHIVDAVLASNIDEVILVTGHESERIIQALDTRKLTICYNSNYKNGLTSSIQTGIQACDNQTKGFLICLSDMPFIQTKHINHILQHLNSNIPNQILIPRIKHKRSHPILFTRSYQEQILNHQEANGCKSIINKHQKDIQFIDFEEDFSRDIDTLESYQEIYRY